MLHSNFKSSWRPKCLEVQQVLLSMELRLSLNNYQTYIIPKTKEEYQQ